MPTRAAQPQARSQRTRDRILRAAREAFTIDGFDRASTKKIATTAGVNSSLIFRYFGSKAGLYEAAVLKPLEGFIEEFVERWQDYGLRPHPPTRTASDFLGGFYDLFRQHHELVQALLLSGRSADVAGARSREMSTKLTELLNQVDRVVDAEARERGWSGYDTVMTTRISLGVAFSLAVLEDWLFPAGESHPTRDQIVAGMTANVLRSISNPGGPTGFEVAPGRTEAGAPGAAPDSGLPSGR